MMVAALLPLTSIGAAALVLLLVACVVVLTKTRVRHFYPNGTELVTLYAKLLVSPLYKQWTWRAKIKPGLKIDPGLTFRLPFRADLQNVKDYIEVCEIDWKGQGKENEIPPFYVSSQFLFPTVCLLSQRRYLFPVLGAIHVSNKFILHAPLPDSTEYTAALKVHEAVELAKRGVNATFSQVLLDQGKEAWVSRTTVLVPARHKHWQERAGVDKGGKVPTTLVEDAKADGLSPKLVKEGTFPVFKDTGLRFAAVVADYNPIHLYPWSAKLFGFKRAIAHGMFVAAKTFHEALAVWGDAGLAYPIEIDLKFIKPVFLPGKVSYQIYRADAKKGDPRLVLLVTNADKEGEVHLQGTVRAYDNKA